MKYSVLINDKIATVEFSDLFNSKELDLVVDMLQNALTIRKEELVKTEAKTLDLSDEFAKMYPPLTTMTKNTLLRAGLKTIGDVLDKTPTELQKIRHMGPKSLQEITERFSRYGSFKEVE